MGNCNIVAPMEVLCKWHIVFFALCKYEIHEVSQMGSILESHNSSIVRGNATNVSIHL